MRSSTLIKVAASAGAVALLTTGCLSSGSSTTAATGTAAGPGKATVEVMYGFGNEQETAFKKDLDKFAAANGFAVKYTKAGSWDTEINLRAGRGSVPAARPHV